MVQATTTNHALAIVDDYILNMGVDISPHDGALQQAALYNAYYSIFNDSNSFDSNMKKLMRKITENKDGIRAPFNEYKAYRFMKNVPLTASQLTELQELTTLFITMGDATTRNKTRHCIDLTKAVAHIKKEAIRQRLIQFFT